MERVATPPGEYLASLPAAVGADMTALDELITAALPGHGRCLWEGVFWGGSEQRIIGYGDMSYVRSDKKRVDWFLVGLARQKNYYSVYVNAVDGRRYLAEAYAGQAGQGEGGQEQHQLPHGGRCRSGRAQRADRARRGADGGRRLGLIRSARRPGTVSGWGFPRSATQRTILRAPPCGTVACSSAAAGDWSTEARPGRPSARRSAAAIPACGVR